VFTTLTLELVHELHAIYQTGILLSILDFSDLFVLELGTGVGETDGQTNGQTKCNA